MNVLFEIEDYNGKKISLTKEDWFHITFFHPEVSDVDEIKDAVIHPVAVKPSVNNSETVKCYYRYNKVKKRYLLVAVKYINEEGFIVTAHHKKKLP